MVTSTMKRQEKNNNNDAIATNVVFLLHVKQNNEITLD